MVSSILRLPIRLHKVMVDVIWEKCTLIQVGPHLIYEGAVMLWRPVINFFANPTCHTLQNVWRKLRRVPSHELGVA